MPRRVVWGNLDAEQDLSRAGRPSSPAAPLPNKVRTVVSGFATLMRAFARDTDELRTLVPVDPERIAEVPGLPRPILSSGPLTDLDGAAALLAWAETPDVASLRPRFVQQDPPSELPLHDLLWLLPHTDPDVVAAVHHRAFALHLSRQLGCALVGARMVDSLADLEEHLRTLEAGAWVVKAPLSAAGRSRHVHRGGAIEPAQLRTLAGLFRRHGPLLFEPWMDRVDDFGCAVLLTPEATRIVGLHRLRVDPRGRFTGIELQVGSTGVRGLAAHDERRFLATAESVAGELRAAGYFGAFGIDAWRYRHPDGGVVLHPLGEINARMTFGLLARVLVDRVAEPLGLDYEARVALVLGKASAASRSSRVPLLLPDDVGTSAWLELLG